jgi:hypothetical protein
MHILPRSSGTFAHNDDVCQDWKSGRRDPLTLMVAVMIDVPDDVPLTDPNAKRGNGASGN